MKPLWVCLISFLALIGNADTIRDWFFPQYKDQPILSFFPASTPWSAIAWVGIIFLIIEAGYRVWLKERQKHAIIPLEIKAKAFHPSHAHDLYGVCLEVLNPPSNTRNIIGIRVIVLSGLFDGFDLAGSQLVADDSHNSLNPGDYLLLKVFKAKNNIYFTNISFLFKSQAGMVEAFSCKSPDYGELCLRITATDVSARDVKVTWNMNDGKFTANTSPP